MTVEEQETAPRTSGRVPDHDSEDDEDEVWIPLETKSTGDFPESLPTAASSSSTSSSDQSTSTPTSTATPQPWTSFDGDKRLKMLQRRLENRVCLRENLVDHPIDLFWKRYLINLARELWELELHVRLGLSMVTMGICLKIFMLSTWYIWYPRVILSTTILVITLVVFDPLGIKDEIKRVGLVIFSPDGAAQAIEQLDMKQLRRLSLSLLMFPTFLEMRTLSFLAKVAGESNSIFLNILLAIALLSTMMHLLKTKHEKPKECIYKGMLILYGFAFFRTLITTDLRRMPVLGAPFLTASGTLLLTFRDDDMEWVSRVLRHALRLTLRDVLSSVSEKVTEDEMLQLAVLRWIADYWASSPEPSVRPPTQSNTQANPTTTANEPRPAATNTSEQPTDARRQQSNRNFRTHEVQWEELFPMLNVATDHMSLEAQELNQNSPNTNTNTNTSTNPNPNTNTATPSGHANPPLRPTRNDDTDPFVGLKQMLMSLDVDERGKPAVMAYRRAVESFPPDRRTAFCISLLRKCPASLAVLFHILFGLESTMVVTLFMVPFIVLEYFRIQAWGGSCREMASAFSPALDSSKEWAIVSSLVGRADSMIILLCGDETSFVRPPKLLLVWHNIEASVSALEVGLTAARCAQTSIVAAEFAGNVMSLVKLGYEVHQHGLLHGVSLMAKEFIILHAYGDSLPQNSVLYTKAAVAAVENAKVVARNAQALAADENLDPFLRPLVWTICALTGHGWLWGNDAANNTGNTNERNGNDSTTTPNPGETTSQTNNSDQTSDTTTHGNTPKKFAEREQHDYSDNDEKRKQTEELSEVMSMVASAYEDEFIDEAEKNEFCEKLSKLSKDEIYNAPLVKGMKQSLQIILENAANRHEWQETEKVMETTITIAPSSSSSSSSRVEIAAVPKTNVSQSNVDICKEETKVRDDKAGLEPPELEEARSDAIDTEETNKEMITTTAIVKHRSINIETSTEQSSSSSAAATATADPTAPSENDGTQRDDEGGQQQHQEGTKDGNDVWIKFGVAALGVVAGGLLMSMGGGGGDHQRAQEGGGPGSHNRDDHRPENTSTVVIEVLTDDEEDDWVSVPKSRK